MDLDSIFFTFITLPPASRLSCLIHRFTTGVPRILASIMPLLEFPTRTPQLDKKTYDALLQRLQNQQFDIRKLELTQQLPSPSKN